VRGCGEEVAARALDENKPAEALESMRANNIRIFMCPVSNTRATGIRLSGQVVDNSANSLKLVL
jgi:hypothetical protein